MRQAIAEDLDIQATVARLDGEDLRGWLVAENEHGRNVVSAYTELEWE